MKEFKVGIYEEQTGYIFIEAKNKGKAEEKADELLEEFGIDEMPSRYGFIIKHRDFDVI